MWSLSDQGRDPVVDQVKRLSYVWRLLAIGSDSEKVKEFGNFSGWLKGLLASLLRAGRLELTFSVRNKSQQSFDNDQEYMPPHAADDEGPQVEGIYPTAALLPHSCSPNTRAVYRRSGHK